MAELAVVFMANDAYAGWARPFLRDQAPDAPLFCIPYAGDMAGIAAMQAEFGFRFVEADYAAIDAFADECFPDGRPRRRNLRKLAALDMPGTPFLYLDCDLLVTSPLAPVLAGLAAAPADLVYFAESWSWVFNRDSVEEMQRRFAAPLASTGGFALRRPGLTSAAVMALIRENWALYQRVRHPDVIDQPLLNLAWRLAGFGMMSLEQALPGHTGQSWFRDAAIVADESGRLWRLGQRVVALHWAGAKKDRATPALAPLMARYRVPGA